MWARLPSLVWGGRSHRPPHTHDSGSQVREITDVLDLSSLDLVEECGLQVEIVVGRARELDLLGQALVVDAAERTDDRIAVHGVETLHHFDDGVGEVEGLSRVGTRVDTELVL